MNDLNGLTKDQAEALRRKQAVLDHGLYTPIPHELYREKMPELQARYDKQDVRDALFIYAFLHAYVNGKPEKDVFMWANLSVSQIEEGTGIVGNRLRRLVNNVEKEELLRPDIKEQTTERKRLHRQ